MSWGRGGERGTDRDTDEPMETEEGAHVAAGTPAARSTQTTSQTRATPAALAGLENRAYALVSGSPRPSVPDGASVCPRPPTGGLTSLPAGLVQALSRPPQLRVGADPTAAWSGGSGARQAG